MALFIMTLYASLPCIQNDNYCFEYCIACVANALATETYLAINIKLTKSRDYT